MDSSVSPAPSVDLRAVADRFSAVFFKGMPADALDGYDVVHTSQVHLVDPAGYLRATFYNAPPEDIAAVTRYVSQIKRSGRHLGAGR